MEPIIRTPLEIRNWVSENSPEWELSKLSDKEVSSGAEAIQKMTRWLPSSAGEMDTKFVDWLEGKTLLDKSQKL